VKGVYNIPSARGGRVREGRLDLLLEEPLGGGSNKETLRSLNFKR
jgi:hypothetical protein